MALNMNSAKTAVSASGTNKLVSELSAGIGKVKTALRGQAYVAFINNVNANWSGTSKDMFIKDLNKKLDTVSSELTKLQNQINTDLNAAKQAFIKADSTIYQAK